MAETGIALAQEIGQIQPKCVPAASSSSLWSNRPVCPWCASGCPRLPYRVYHGAVWVHGHGRCMGAFTGAFTGAIMAISDNLRRAIKQFCQN